MSTQACVEAVETRLQTNWVTTDIAWPNVDYKPTGSAYVRCNVFGSWADNGILGTNLKRYRGVIRISVFVPRGDGLVTAQTYADTIAAIFNNQDFDDVVCHVGRQEQGPGNEAYSQIDLLIPYRFEVRT